MKLTLVAFLFLINISSFASEINSSFTGTYHSHDEYFKMEVVKAEGILKSYLSEHLGCSSTKLAITSLTRGGWFKDHTFKLQLTSSCTASLQDFQFNFFPPFDWEDSGSLVFEYSLTNKIFHKEFTWDANGNVHEF